jgi:hypothetical protein
MALKNCFIKNKFKVKILFKYLLRVNILRTADKIHYGKWCSEAGAKA